MKDLFDLVEKRHESIQKEAVIGALARIGAKGLGSIVKFFSKSPMKKSLAVGSGVLTAAEAQGATRQAMGAIEKSRASAFRPYMGRGV